MNKYLEKIAEQHGLEKEAAGIFDFKGRTGAAPSKSIPAKAGKPYSSLTGVNGKSSTEFGKPKSALAGAKYGKKSLLSRAKGLLTKKLW